MKRFKKFIAVCIAIILTLTPVTVSAQMNGIDISNWQSNINVTK